MTKNKLKKLIQNFSVVLGIVLIWRGLWYLLDAIDLYLFQGGHAFTAIGGVILGLVILYLPDHDLKELSNL
ncbi:hypothetical protein K8R04_02435 [Candidatus Uhrbacteria bacterium]|nr:hypothetical protein [Candidatus Uhrbacteria bacterium]